MSKLLVCALMLCCPLCVGFVQSAKAHVGHEHLPSELNDKLSRRALISEFKPYLDKKFEIVIDGEHVGHFYLSKLNTKRNSSFFKLEQTFHLEDGDLVDSKIKAEYLPDDKTLKYHVNGDENDYEIWIDFQNLDGADNSGVRITYSNDIEKREILVEDIIVRQILESESGDHSHGDEAHGGDEMHDGMDMN